MPHSFVVCLFDPWISSRWLTPSARLAAAKIQAQPFWALRVSLADEEHYKDTPIMNPTLLYVVSTIPSPIPIANSSLVLGPKASKFSSSRAYENPELVVKPPLPSFELALQIPVYLHTTPRIRIHWSFNKPFTRISYVLDDTSLLKFKDIALDNIQSELDYWRQVVRPARGQVAMGDVPVEWSTFSGPEDPYVLGGLNNPQAYAFHFLEGSDRPVEYTSYIYHELYLYNQIRKDYSWFGVEATIAWVRETRQYIFQALSNQSGSQGRPATETQDNRSAEIQDSAMAETPNYVLVVVEAQDNRSAEAQSDPIADNAHVETQSKRNVEAQGGTVANESAAPTFPAHNDPALHAAAQALFAMRNPFEIDPQLQTAADEDANRVGSGSSPNSDGSHEYDPDTDPILPPAFPKLAGKYSIVKCGLVKVVAFEVFGVILNREDAIRRALQEWLPFVPRTCGLDDVVRRYVHYEAFTERDLESCNEITLETIIQGGLQALAEQLHIDPSEQAHLLSTALTTILTPHPYPDAGSTIADLKRRGYSLVCLPPHSPSDTLEHARRVLPAGTLDGVRVFPKVSSVHFASLTRDPAFGSTFQEFCSEGVVSNLRGVANAVADATSGVAGGADGLTGPARTDDKDKDSDSDEESKLLNRNEIIIATAGMGRVVVGAQEGGFATCLVERADCRESLVSFALGGGGYRHPVPSIIVEGFAALGKALAKEAELFAAAAAAAAAAAEQLKADAGHNAAGAGKVDAVCSGTEGRPVGPSGVEGQPTAHVSADDEAAVSGSGSEQPAVPCDAEGQAVVPSQS
ncbi:hypothetical protein GY45DRAFT_1437883 [Cubamyces sp. BRFM 1775]|nr:hypothetical protein GY45DRAFT_1437883 [Cubamyces sp. BRFM 1775]